MWRGAGQKMYPQNQTAERGGTDSVSVKEGEAILRAYTDQNTYSNNQGRIKRRGHATHDVYCV